jgi:hypothetical protein
MKTRILYPKNIWFNKQFKGLTMGSKLVCLYLVSNENIGLTNIYKQHDLEICFLLGITEKILEKIKEEISETGLFYFYEEWIFINNNFSYCDYGGRDRLINSKNKEISEIPEEIKEYFKGVKKGLQRGYKPPINHKYKIINNNNKLIPPNLVNNTHDDKDKNFSKIEDLTLKDKQEIADKYLVTLPFVESIYDDMVNYCESKGKKYENYKATLRNWVKRESMKRKEAHAIKTPRIVEV